MTRSRSRSGITLIEIVVVLGILLFLLALLVPAVQRVRKAADTSRALNNLKQICIGMHNYHSSYNVMPAVVGPGPDGTHGTFFFHLLPFLEQDNLRRQGAVWKAGTIGTPLSLFLDERDKSAPSGNRFDGWLATGNYAASWPSFKVSASFIQVMTDGTSNTIAVTERYQVCNNNPCAWGYDELHAWAPMFGYTTRGKFQLAPSQAECNPALPQSLDALGILVGMGDGSARRVAASVSPLTWDRAVTPDDGNPLPNDWND